MIEASLANSNDEAIHDSFTPFHLDDFQGPQKRILSVFPYTIYNGSTWNCYISLGMATNEQKAPLVEEIAKAGSPLNPKYFLNAENLELWVDNALAGLCRLRLSSPDEEGAMAAGESFMAIGSLEAVFVRPCYQSLGFGELISEYCAELVTNSLFAHIRERYSSYPSIEVILRADFESAEGERFFDQLTDTMQMNMEMIAGMLKIPIKVSTDAGF